MIDTVEQHLDNPTPTERPLAVAYVVHNFNVGGLERCVARLANRLDRTRFTPSIICLDRNGTAAQWLERDDIKVVELHKKPGNDLGVVRKLARALRELSVDVVHSHNWGTLVETTIARKWAGTPVHIHAERGMELDALGAASWKQKLRGRATRWALQRCDEIIAVAEAVRAQVLHRCGTLRRPITVIPNGVTQPPVDPAGPSPRQIRQQFHIADTAAIVGSVGRLAPVKDFGLAIAATKQLIDRGRDVHLLLVGDGAERETLTTRAAEAGIADRVHFAGRRDDVGNWLSAMDVYVNTSLNEGMSQSVLEAMSAGLPQVVTDVGDSGLLVGGDDPVGRVVPAGDADALAAAIDDIVSDENLRRELGRRATLRHRDRYSLDGMVDQYETLYENLAAAHQRGPSRVPTTESVT